MTCAWSEIPGRPPGSASAKSTRFRDTSIVPHGVPVSDAFRDYVLEQLAELGAVNARRMFGGVGLYCGEVFFGVINDNLLYLRVDETSRPLFEAAGMTALRPVRAKPEVVAAYYQAPDHVLEDAETLVEWVRRSVAVAAGQSRPASRPAGKRRKKRRT
jgi:DNA transformation protein